MSEILDTFIAVAKPLSYEWDQDFLNAATGVSASSVKVMPIVHVNVPNWIPFLGATEFIGYWGD